MNFLDHNRALLLAGAVALAGATACSRSDRADAGRDTTQSGAVNSAVVPADTQNAAAGQTPTADTGSATAQTPTADTGKTGVTSKPKPPRTRIHPGTDSAKGGDQGAGYPNPSSEGTPSDSSQIRPTPDSGVSAAPSAPSPSDTAPVGLSTTVGDTAAGEIFSASDSTNVPTADVPTADVPTADVPTADVPTADVPTADPTSVAVTDSAAVAPEVSDPAAVDTTEVAADTTVAGADTAEVAAEMPAADTAAAGYSEMARDTTSVLAQVDTAAAATPADEDTANIEVQVDTATAEATLGGDSVTVATGDANVASPDTGRIRPPADSAEVATSESSVDAAGAAPMGGGVTGVDAVATMTRAGARCAVRDDSPDVFWDLADSPVALNPCGTGTMTLSLVRTGEKSR
jgi:hypothetical protein